MHERDGCALLKRRFEAKGYRIRENVAFDEDGVSFEIDGWDAALRVGYEYLTAEAGDRDDLTPDEMEKLEARMHRGELFVLLVDEEEAPDAELLALAADRFLSQLPAASRPAKAKTRKKKPAVKKKKPVKKSKKPAAKKKRVAKKKKAKK